MTELKCDGCKQVVAKIVLLRNYGSFEVKCKPCVDKNAVATVDPALTQ